jgi:uncharacterized protein YdaU (DUF1376 family)
MSLPYFPLYPGDYLADTAHLRTVEHGAYLLLLMAQWRNGSVPDDDVMLARIARLRLDKWRRMSPVIREFFGPGDKPGTLQQKRLNAELAHAREVSEARAKAARARKNGNPTKTPHGDTNPPPNSLNGHDLGSANAEQLPNNPKASPYATTSGVEAVVETPFAPPYGPPTPHLTPLKNNETTPAIAEQMTVYPDPEEGRKEESEPLRVSLCVREATGFAAFWAGYPRKDEKADARKAYAAALKSGATPEVLLAALLAYPFDLRDGGRWVPYPAKWLKRGSWECAGEVRAAEAASPAGKPSNLTWMNSPAFPTYDPDDDLPRRH